MRARSGLLGCLLLATAVLPVLPSQAEESQSKVQVWAFEQVAAPARLAWQVRLTSAGGDAGALATIIADGSLRRVLRTTSSQVLTFGGPGQPRAYGLLAPLDCENGVIAPACTPSGGAGTFTGGSSVTASDMTQPKVVFIAARAATTSLTITESTGWRRRAMPAVAARFVLSTDEGTSADGFTTAYATAESFSRGSAPGGARGSVAASSIPCGLTRELSAMRLDGGATAPSGCGRLHDVAVGRTLWTVSGRAAGLHAWGDSVRLVVIDL